MKCLFVWSCYVNNRKSRGRIRKNKNRNKWEEEVIYQIREREIDVITLERGNLITMHYMFYIEEKSDK